MMNYRGDDFDLRLPPGRSSTGRTGYADADRPADSNGQRYRVKAHGRDRTSPLWVDDTVLAVCNAAHEVAQAMHSPEVLLQHLVHGMTRVSTAAAALEAQRIDIHELRRDVTALISSTAARLPDSGARPLTSSEFKAALRLSGEAASRRNGDAITIDDLLEVLMNYDTDHPGVELLLTHIDGGRGRAQPQRIEEAYMPRQYVEPMTTARYVEREPLRATIEPLRLDTARAAYEPRPFPARSSYQAPRDDAGSMFEAMEQRLLGRLNAIEASYRADLQGLEAERRALGDLVRQMHNDVAAHRTETVSLRDALSGKLETIERSATSAVRGSNEGIAPIMSRLQGIERMFDSRLENVAQSSTTLGEKVKLIEAALGRQARESAEIKDALAEEIKHLNTAVGRIKVEVPDFDEAFGGRLDTIETLLLERGSEMAGLPEDQIAQIEKLVVSRGGLTGENVSQIETMLAAHGKQMMASMAERERNWTAVNERLNKMEHIMAAQNEATQTAAADRKRVFNHMNEQLTQLEKVVVTQAQTGQGRGPSEGLLNDMRNMLSRVSSAQQTTAEVLDQWRLDMSGDLSVLNNRLEHLERTSVQPVAMLDSLSADVRNLHAMTMEKRTIKRPQIEIEGGLWASFSNWMFGPR